MIARNTKPFALALVAMSVLTACGGGGGSSSGGTTQPTNTAPVFGQASYSFPLDEDMSLSMSVSATDADGDALTYSVVTQPANGELTIDNSGDFTFTPAANYNGADTATIRVSDGNATAQATIDFDIAAINDAPVLSTTQVTVSGQGVTSGQIVINDVDNDTITITVTTPPTKGQLDLNGATGEFTYTPDTLEQIDGSFSISYTDGNIDAPLTADISLVPSFATNADKLSFYYSSEKSHLKQVENIVAQLDDDIAEGELNADLAKGYIIGGFNDTARTTLEKIVELSTKARAYREAGVILDQQSKTPAANEFRNRAEYLYNLYLAERGLANISSSDASFYQTLVNNYLDAGQPEEANKLLSTVFIYADAVREEEYNTAYGRFLTAFNAHAGNATENYFAAPSATTLKAAEDAIDIFASLVEKTGYQVQRTGTFAGQNVDRLKALYMAWAAEYYQQINANDKAKEFAAKALSLYTAVNYDSNFTYEAGANAEATLGTYKYPLQILSGLIAGLYPTLETNPALALLAVDSRDHTRAQEQIFAHTAVNQILSGTSVADAIKPAVDYFTADDDLRSLYQTLVEFGPSDPRIAMMLHYRGETALAEQVLAEAANVLASSDYVTGQSFTTYITGSRGCTRLTQIYQQIGSPEKAVANVQVCRDIVDNYFQASQGNFSTTATISALQNLMGTYFLVNDQTGMQFAATRLVEEMARFTEVTDQISSQLNTAAYLASYGQFDIAKPIFDDAMNKTLTQLSAADIDADSIEDLLDDVASEVVGADSFAESFYQKYRYVNAIRMYAGKTDNYQQRLADANALTKTVVERLNSAIAKLTVNERQGLVEDQLTLNAWARMTTEATALVASDINEPADKIALNQELGRIISLKDDFPASNVANVDTDEDGLVNFFLLDATADAIEASGLEADTDSDNDGIADDQDATPIG